MKIDLDDGSSARVDRAEPRDNGTAPLIYIDVSAVPEWVG